MKEVKYFIEGMSCTNCALGIENFLKNEKASNVSVNFLTGEAVFEIDENIHADTYINGIQKLGYQVKSINPSTHQPINLSTHQPINPSTIYPKSFWTLDRKFYFSLLSSIPLFMTMFLHIPFLKNLEIVHFLHFLDNGFLQLFICLPAFIIGVSYFGSSAWSSLRTGVANMDVLIFTGITSSFIYSLISTFYGGELYYETSATITSLVLLGNLMEEFSIRKTTSAIDELHKIQVKTAIRITVGLDGAPATLQEVSYDEIQVNDLLLLKNGEKIPVDGTITEGALSVDESMITGESIPVYKNIRDKVISGTVIVDGNGKMIASAVQQDTLLQKIIQMVKQAQNSKPSIQKIGDRISAIFVPVVIVVSVLSFITMYFYTDSFSTALMSAIAVLVISCPCAMGLATPTAIMVGIGRAARSGILIKGGNIIENMAKVQHIVFDKTGTLTTGKFIVQEIKTFGLGLPEITNLLYHLEKHSNHPIARSISKIYETHSEDPFSEVEELKGAGMRAKDHSKNEYFLGSKNINPSLVFPEGYDLFLTINNELKAAIKIQDDIKTNTLDCINELKRMNITPIMLSGDKNSKCSFVAKQLGIDRFYGEKLPHEKLEIIAQLNQSATVAMVGDGINDAPALAKAGIGVSLGNASDVAISSADIILLNGNLKHLITAIKICKKTYQTIKQNLFWAFAYNIIAIPIAFVGMLQPIFAALTMAFSDVIIIGNSILLKTKNIDKS